MTILQANSHSIDQKNGEIWTGQALLQPISFKSDRLIDCLFTCSALCAWFGELIWMSMDVNLAERAGFEPALGINLNTLSRRAT